MYRPIDRGQEGDVPLVQAVGRHLSHRQGASFEEEYPFLGLPHRGFFSFLDVLKVGDHDASLSHYFSGADILSVFELNYPFLKIIYKIKNIFLYSYFN